MCCIPGYQYRYSICLRATYSSFISLLKNDSGKCLEKFRSIYIERSAGFAIKYYDELYKRGIATRKLSERTVYMLSLAEFSMVCEIIADDTCQSGITPEMKIAFMEAMNVLLCTE